MATVKNRLGKLLIIAEIAGVRRRGIRVECSCVDDLKSVERVSD